MPNLDDLPDDVAALKAMLAEARASAIERELEIEQLRRDIAASDLEITRLKLLIDKLKRMHFGRKSEQLAREIEKLELRLEDLAAGSGVADVQHTKVRRERSTTSSDPAVREPLPPHLTREDRVLKPDSICPKCEGAMQCLGEDVSEQLARVAAMFKVIRTIRHKTVCPACGHIAQPPMPGLPIERSIAHPSLLADILVSKYADHAPLYRQSEIAARDGVTLDRASMGRWVGQCEALCRPLTDALRRYTMAGTKLHADDTPIPVLAPGNKKTKTGRL